MKLNYECIRDTLLFLEKSCNLTIADDGVVTWVLVDAQEVYAGLPKYNDTDIFYTLFNLEQAGYIDANSSWSGDSVIWYTVNYITFAGHEFLDAIRNNNNWNKTKAVAKKVGSFSLKAIYDIANQIAAMAIHSALIS